MDRCAKELLRIAEEISGNEGKDEDAKIDAAADVGHDADSIAYDLDYFNYGISEIHDKEKKEGEKVELLSTEEIAKGNALEEKMDGLKKAFWTAMGSKTGDSDFTDEDPRDWTEVKAVAGQIMETANEIAAYVGKAAQSALAAIRGRIAELDEERNKLTEGGIDTLLGEGDLLDYDRWKFDDDSYAIARIDEKLETWHSRYKDVVWGENGENGDPRKLIMECREFNRSYQRLVSVLG